jgi:amino-acid N-acetyltransferase
MVSTSERSDPHLRSATAADEPAVGALLTECGLPVAGIRAGLPGFWVAEVHDGIVGVIGLEEYESFGLLRSAAVRRDARGRGIGALLTEHLIAIAEERGIRGLFLLTETAETFFPRFGFAIVGREYLPPELNGSAELQGACPASAIAMVRVPG